MNYLVNDGAPGLFQTSLSNRLHCGRFSKQRAGHPLPLMSSPGNSLLLPQSDPVAHDAIAQCLTVGNQVWARRAPVLVVALARTIFSHNGRPNRHAYYDVGQAVAMLSVQAMYENLYVHQMAGFDREKVVDQFKIKSPCEAVVVMAIGYIGDSSSLPVELRDKERSSRRRKHQDSFVFNGLWTN